MSVALLISLLPAVTSDSSSNTNNNLPSNNITVGEDVSTVSILTVKDNGFISDQALEQFLTVFTCMMPVLCVLAVIFCIFNAAVYWQQRPARFALYLVAVDLGDGVCSLVELLNSVVFFALPAHAYGHLVVKWYLAKYVAASCRRAAVCLNAFASLERFLAIAFPLKAFSRTLFSKPTVIIAATFILCLIAHVYFALEFEVARTGAGGWSLTHTSLRLKHPDVFVLWALVDSIIFAYSPLVAIMVLNTTLLIVLHAHTSSLKTVRKVQGSGMFSSSSVSQQDGSGLMSVSSEFSDNQKKVALEESKRKKDNQTTKMVMVFTTVVFVMALPRMLNSSARIILPDYGPKGEQKNLYNAVSLLSQITSHFTETALFWVSLAYSRSFRRSVLRLPFTRWLFGRWLKKASYPATSSSDVSSSTKASNYLPQ